MEADQIKAIETIESLLNDMERVLAERGELNDENRAALARLRRMCSEEKATLSRKED